MWIPLFLIICNFYPTFAIDVDLLMSKMSLEEKIGQMVQIDINAMMNSSDPSQVNFTDVAHWINTYKIGSILSTPFQNGKELYHSFTCSFLLIINILSKGRSEAKVGTRPLLGAK